MTLSLEEISARLEIQELISRYSHIIDAKRFDDADALFTTDGTLDYTATGGLAGGYKAVLERIAEGMAILKSSQHLVGASTISLDGDTATARSICHVSMTTDQGDQGTHVFFSGLNYADAFARTSEGWRFSHRLIEDPWFSGRPAN